MCIIPTRYDLLTQLLSGLPRTCKMCFITCYCGYWSSGCNPNLISTLTVGLMVALLQCDWSAPPLHAQSMSISHMHNMFHHLLLWLMDMRMQLQPDIYSHNSQFRLTILSCFLPFTLYPFWTGVRVKGNPYPVITR